MFVLEALLLTFMTTPAVVLLYPPELRKRVAASGPSFGHVDDGTQEATPTRTRFRRGRGHDDDLDWKERFLVVLDRAEHLPGMMSLTQLIQPPPPYDDDTNVTPRDVPGSSSSSRESQKRAATPGSATAGSEQDVSIDALRLIEITDRTSAVMKYSSFSTDALLQTDPLLTIFRTFVELGGSGSGLGSEVKMVPYDDLAICVKDEALHKESRMVLIPWVPPAFGRHVQHEHDDGEGLTSEPPVTPRHVSTNPFESLFKTGGVTSGGRNSSSSLHSHFVRSVFAQCPADVMLYVDQDHSSPGTNVSRRSFSAGKHHLFLPFFGGPDDRLALEFVVQLCTVNPKISATVVRLIKREFEVDLGPIISEEKVDGTKTADEDRNERINALTVSSVGISP